MKQKIIRITTVPISLKYLIKGQMRFMSKNGFEVTMISADGEEIKDKHIKEVWDKQIKEIFKPDYHESSDKYASVTELYIHNMIYILNPLHSTER